MPSGHSTAAFAGFVVLALCTLPSRDGGADLADINAHAKVFGPAQTPLWKLVCFLAPILGACLIAGSLTIDEVPRAWTLKTDAAQYHSWYDCFAVRSLGRERRL